jgi:hypothetical protein
LALGERYIAGAAIEERSTAVGRLGRIDIQAGLGGAARCGQRTEKQPQILRFAQDDNTIIFLNLDNCSIKTKAS